MQINILGKLQIGTISLIIGLVLVMLILTLIGKHYYTSSKKAPSLEIVNTKVFTCPLMGGYQFEYPVFKGLENISVENISNDSCELRISESDKNHIIFVIRTSVGLPTNAYSRFSPNMIYYVLSPSKDTIFFEIKKIDDTFKSNSQVTIHVKAVQMFLVIGPPRSHIGIIIKQRNVIQEMIIKSFRKSL